MKLFTHILILMYYLSAPSLAFPQIMSLDVGCLSSNCLTLSDSPSISNDGSRIAFITPKKLLQNDTYTNTNDVYVWDENSGFILITTRLVSGGAIRSPSISGDGRYVTYASSLSHTNDDTNTFYDIFRYDIDTQTTELVSISSSGLLGNGHSGVVFNGNISVPPALTSASSTNSAISTSGRYIAFQSYATNLVSGDTRSNSDIFVRDMSKRITEKVSLRFNGEQTFSKSRHPSISPNGRYVAFETNGSLNHENGILNLNWFEPHVYDRENNLIHVLGERSSTPDTAPLQNYAGFSLTNSKIFYHARKDDSEFGSSQTTRIFERQLPIPTQVTGSIQQQGAEAFSASASLDGRYLIYFSRESLQAGISTAGKTQLYIHDIVNNEIKMISVSVNNTAGNNDSGGNLNSAHISANACKIVFYSQSTNLVTNNTNTSDLFIANNPFLSSSDCTPAQAFCNSQSSLSMQRWATRQGGFWDAQQWLVGDFNGDGFDDMGKAFSDVGLASIDVHLSNGNNIFSIQHWATQQGGFWDTQQWLAGDFNGDGFDDIVKVFNDAGLASIDVHLSNGSGAFTIQRWATRQGGFWDEQQWLVGDFNGDGFDDMGKAFSDEGLASIDAHLSNGNGAFTIQRWATRQGNFWDEQQWLVGDFNGDGFDDMGKTFNDAGLASIDIHSSNGSSFFTLQCGALRQGSFWNEQQWLAGDFDGNNIDDLAKAFEEDEQASIDVHFMP